MSYWKPLVPASFAVPPRHEGEGFHLRMLTVNDVVKDYDAVMTSAARLKGCMNPESAWPDGLTLEDDLIDLGWHQREFTMHRSFCYTVMEPDESICLGCAYIYPSEKKAYDAKVFWWVRDSALPMGLDEQLGTSIRGWIKDVWPFGRVAYPGRDISWAAWRAEP
jgi:hypothetical protein